MSLFTNMSSINSISQVFSMSYPTDFVNYHLHLLQSPRISSRLGTSSSLADSITSGKSKMSSGSMYCMAFSSVRCS